MATRSQIDKLAARIDALAAAVAPPEQRWEHWIVDGDKARRYDDPEHVITVAEMRARPVNLIVCTLVDAVNGRGV